MPTARPSIRARAGVIEAISITEDSARVPPTPAPTPSTAISSGKPAATRVPSMTSSTAAATARPMISAAPKIEERSCRISLEKSTSTPAASGPAAMDWMSARWPVVSESVCPVKVTCATAVEPSAEMKRMSSEAPAWRLANSSSTRPAARSLAPASSFASAAGSAAVFSSMVFCPATILAWFVSISFWPAANVAPFVSSSACPARHCARPAEIFAATASSLVRLADKLPGPGIQLLLGCRQPCCPGLELRLPGIQGFLPGGQLLGT